MPSTDQTTINKILEEVLGLKNELAIVKKDLRSAIEASEVRLLLKLEETTSRVRELEVENSKLKHQLEYLDKSSRKNNLIVFGLQTSEKINVTYVCQQLNTLLSLDLNESDFSDVFPLGSSNRCPIKLELISFQQKKIILGSCNKLKGSHVIISNDLTEVQRRESKLLRKHLQQARQNSGEKCFIRANKLHVGSKVYTPKDLEEFDDEGHEGQKFVSSAPSTPTIPVDEVFEENVTQKEPAVGTPKNIPTRNKSHRQAALQQKQAKNKLNK